MNRFSYLLTHLGLIIAASAAFSMSALFSSVKPVLLTQFMREVGYEAGLSGWMVAAPFIGISLAVIFVGTLIARYSYRQILSYTGLILVCCQLLNSQWFINPNVTLIFQLCSGICVGILMGVTSCFIARCTQASTLFGLVDMIGVLLMSLMVAGAGATTEQYGLPGGFVFSALLCTLYWACMYFYQPVLVAETRHTDKLPAFKLTLRPVLIITMGVLFVTFSGQGFAFMFTMASNLGMTYEQAGSSIGLILFLSAFACLAGGLCSARFGPEKSLLLAFIVCATGWAIAINSQSKIEFLCALFPAICALQFSFPILLSLAGKLDNDGRWAAIATPLLTSGFAWAAVMSGQVVELWGLDTLATTTVLGMLICIVLLGLITWAPFRGKLEPLI